MERPISTMIFLILAYFSFGQEKQDFEYSISSEAFGKERKVYVHLPETYHENPSDSFGVIYILDAQARSFYEQAKGILSYLNWSRHIFPVIAVGICSDNRGSEFVPLNRSLAAEDEDNFGRAHVLQEHLSQEVFPLIEKTFRVNDFRGIIGHSRGGAFLATTLFSDQKDLFHAYIAVSPGMHYLDGQILKDAEQMIVSQAKFNKFFFATHGTVGSLEKYFEPQVNHLDSLFREHPNETLHWNKLKVNDATHWSCVAPSVAQGLMEMSRAYQVDQYLIDLFASSEKKTIKEQVEAYYEEQEAKLGFTFPLPASRYHYYAGQQSEYGNAEQAIELYDLALEAEPNRIRSLWGKSWIYEEKGENEQVKPICDEILKIVELNEIGMTEEDQEKWRERIRKRLAE